MRRRICFVAAALTAGPLAVGIAIVPAATAKRVAKSKPVVVNCSTAATIEIPAGQTALVPPLIEGAQYGSAHCAGLFGTGVQADNFTIPDSGDMVGQYTQYFASGSITAHLI